MVILVINAIWTFRNILFLLFIFNSNNEGCHLQSFSPAKYNSTAFVNSILEGQYLKYFVFFVRVFFLHILFYFLSSYCCSLVYFPSKCKAKINGNLKKKSVLFYSLESGKEKKKEGKKKRNEKNIESMEKCIRQAKSSALWFAEMIVFLSIFILFKTKFTIIIFMPNRKVKQKKK